MRGEGFADEFVVWTVLVLFGEVIEMGGDIRLLSLTGMVTVRCCSSSEGMGRAACRSLP